MPSERPTKPTFPARDDAGRIATARDMVIGTVAWVAVGAALLIAIDGLVSLAAGGFGHISGWIAGTLAVLMFIEDFRAWRVGAARIGVALLGTALGVLAGVILAGQVAPLMPAVFAGALAVLLATLVYAIFWFYGVRIVAARLPER
jgi:hypothetical protein